MQFTSIGAALLAALCFVALVRPVWCIAFLPLAAVLQTHALAIVSLGGVTHGVSLFNGMMLFAGLQILVLAASKARAEAFSSAIRQPGFLLWALFALVSVVGALVLPMAFEGLPVIQMYGNELLSQPFKPLKLNINHIAQSINTVGNVVCLFQVAFMSKIYGQKVALKVFACGFVAAAAVSIAIAVYQRAFYFGMVPLDPTFWATNPSLIQSFDSIYGEFLGFRRVSLPFIEPSYAGAWFAAGVAAMYAVACLFRFSFLGILGLFAFSGALANTFAATGMLALLLWFLGFVGILLGSLGYRMLRPPAAGALVRTRSVLLCGATILIFGGLFLASPSLQNASKVIGSKIAELRSDDAQQGFHRGDANKHALHLLYQTKGLGVGAGSNRTSGFLHGLLGNLGLLGTALFLTALIYQVRKNILQLRVVSTDAQRAIVAHLAALSCLLIAMVGGIADQNWPVLWVLLIWGHLLSAGD